MAAETDLDYRGAVGPLLDFLMRKFLSVAQLCWDDLVELGNGEIDEVLLSNWMQSQWELLVEQPLNSHGHECSLLVYGGGADTDTSRVFPRDPVETHAICCRPRSGSVLVDCVERRQLVFPRDGWAVDEFLSVEGLELRAGPPFNAVKLLVASNGRPHAAPPIFLLEQVEFVLTPLPRGIEERWNFRSAPAVSWDHVSP